MYSTKGVRLRKGRWLRLLHTSSFQIQIWNSSSVGSYFVMAIRQKRFWNWFFFVDCDFFLGISHFWIWTDKAVSTQLSSLWVKFYFSYRKRSKRTCHDVISISSGSLGDNLFLSRLSNFAEENNIGLQTLARNDQKWSNFIRSFGSTSTIETSRSQVNLICIHVSESYHFTLTMTNFD